MLRLGDDLAEGGEALPPVLVEVGGALQVALRFPVRGLEGCGFLALVIVGGIFGEEAGLAFEGGGGVATCSGMLEEYFEVHDDLPLMLDEDVLVEKEEELDKENLAADAVVAGGIKSTLQTQTLFSEG